MKTPTYNQYLCAINADRPSNEDKEIIKAYEANRTVKAFVTKQTVEEVIVF